MKSRVPNPPTHDDKSSKSRAYIDRHACREIGGKWSTDCTVSRFSIFRKKDQKSLSNTEFSVL